MKKINVSWNDSMNFSGWNSKTEKWKCNVVHTIGFLVEDTSEQIVVCQSYTADHYCNVISIPKNSVIDITY